MGEDVDDDDEDADDDDDENENELLVNVLGMVEVEAVEVLVAFDCAGVTLPGNTIPTV